MNVKITFERDEFEPLLIDLISKALNRQVSPNEVESILFEFANGSAYQMIATLQLQADS